MKRQVFHYLKKEKYWGLQLKPHIFLLDAPAEFWQEPLKIQSMCLHMFNRHLGKTVSSDSDLVSLVFQVFYSRYWGETEEHDQGPQALLETRVDVVGTKTLKNKKYQLFGV